MKLDDNEHQLHPGDTVIMPAGTIISGTNTEVAMRWLMVGLRLQTVRLTAA
jgi:hypothetical protein